MRVYATTPDEDAAAVQRFLSRCPASGHAATVEVGALGLRARPREAAPGEERPFPVRLSTSRIFLGPAPRRGGACPVCLEMRWRALRSAAERRLEPDDGFTVGSNPLLTPFALEALWSALCLLLGDRARADQVHVLDPATLRLEREALLPVSLCPRCGGANPDTAAGAVLPLVPRPKRTPDQYRLVAVESLERHHRTYVNPLFGPLGAVAAPDYTHAVCAPVRGQLASGDRQIAWGGNAERYDRSRSVGMLEGLERQAGQRPLGKTIAVSAPLARLTEPALDPRRSGGHDDPPPGMVPFSAELELDWVWGFSLGAARPLLVPAQMVYYGRARGHEPSFVRATSSGCAAGSCPEEALLFALLELIERDAFLITWYARLSLPRIDPASCQDQRTLLLIDRIERLGYQVDLVDMRLDLAPPAVLACARRRDDRLGSVVLAAACSLDPDQAILGALREVASYASGFEARMTERLDRARALAGDFHLVEEIEDHALLYGLPEMAGQLAFLFASPILRSVEETYAGWRRAGPRHQDLRDDLGFLRDDLAGAGLPEVIAVDQTSPEQERIGMCTMRAIVPGLLPITFGQAHRRTRGLPRLATVPRTAGFRGEDLAEDGRNPLPHPFP
jgi:ribosomal protein S12 methylthiotransferase accessory factor